MNKTRLITPVDEEEVRKVRVGDIILVNGIVVTARDTGHKFLIEETTPEKFPVNLKNGIIYHAGPIVRKSEHGWEIMAAGPTTSERMNFYTPEVIKRYQIRAIIGKGGMSNNVARAMRRFGAIYLSAVGGAAQFLTSTIKKVEDVFMADKLGLTEAFWVLKVEDFPTICTIDSTGRNWHEKIFEESEKKAKAMMERIWKNRS